MTIQSSLYIIIHRIHRKIEIHFKEVGRNKILAENKEEIVNVKIRV